MYSLPTGIILTNSPPSLLVSLDKAISVGIDKPLPPRTVIAAGAFLVSMSIFVFTSKVLILICLICYDLRNFHASACYANLRVIRVIRFFTQSAVCRRGG